MRGSDSAFLCTLTRIGGPSLSQVVMLNRPSGRASGAEGSLRRAFPGAQVETIACDLQSFASVKKAAEEMAAKLGEVGLDALVNNAGVMALADIATGDGYDVQMQTNHLSHFLLTREVWPLLEKAAEVRGEARVVNHSSLARMGKVLDARYLKRNGGALGGNGNSMLFGGARWLRYHQTKLANVVFTLALADKVAAAGTSKIVVACAAPGLAATNLQVQLLCGTVRTVGLHRVRCDHDVVHDAGLMHGTFPVGDDGRGRRHEGHVDHALGAVCRRRGNAYSALPSCRGRAIGRLFRAPGHGRQGYSGQQAPQAVR